MTNSFDGDRLAVGFARVLRGAGLDVPVGTTILFTEALGAVGVSTRESVYWAGRATLVSRPEDIELYDRSFAAWWDRVFQLSTTTVEEREIILAFDTDRDDDVPDDDDDDQPRDAPTLAVRYSRAEVLRQRDFAHYSPDEFAESRRLMNDLRLAGSMRRSRRMRASRRDRGRPDLRRTVRRALRAGGEPISRAFVAPAERPRRLVLLCDVSGSMEAYARGLVRFLHAAVVGRGRVEAFAIGTRLTRITRELSSHDPDAAITAAAKRVTDWSGGTRLGEGLRQFNDEWGVRGMARGAVVVILSDGWDRGDPEVLGEQMARLHRVAHQVVWVNPLKSSPNFAPLARGMAAALPHVDEFVEGHNLASLEQLARIVSGEKLEHQK
ncbi:MAG TPA: VWA domain-containing protein [Acidimicrobiia bacterium]|jgi:hypothetical protein